MPEGATFLCCGSQAGFSPRGWRPTRRRGERRRRTASHASRSTAHWPPEAGSSRRGHPARAKSGAQGPRSGAGEGNQASGEGPPARPAGAGPPTTVESTADGTTAVGPCPKSGSLIVLVPPSTDGNSRRRAGRQQDADRPGARC